MNKKLEISICVPAYNEEKNIAQLLNSLLRQKVSKVSISSIVVVLSGCTDNTENIVRSISQKNPQVKLIVQSSRNGKAEAINAFLKDNSSPIVVIQSADTIAKSDTIERLCTPFLKDEKIGMTGGAPIPVNNPESFLGYIIHSWWWFHRNIPRFGEIIAFRNVLPKVYEKTAVDEAYIQAKMVQLGYKVVHIDEAVVTNKGPETVGDLIRQRRRIFNGHARLSRDENVRISNMTRSSLSLLLFKYQIKSIKHFLWLIGGIGIEIVSRILGAYDTHVLKLNPFRWDTATTTKHVIQGRAEAHDLIS